MRRLPPLFFARVPARFGPRLVAVLSVTTVGFVWINSPGAIGAGVAQPPPPAPPLAQQVSDVGAQLISAGNAVAVAQAAVDAADDQLPAAEQALAAAQSANAAAQENEKAAQAAVVQAEADVAAQQAVLGRSAEQIAGTNVLVAHLAREAYKSGGQAPQEIEILLQSRSPASFADQIQVIKRTARGNNQALANLRAAQKAQRQALETLTRTQQSLATRQASAREQAAAAEATRQRAGVAQANVQSVIQERQTQLDSVSRQRGEVTALYKRLLAQQQDEMVAAAKAQKAADAAAAKKAAEQAAKEKQAGKAPAKAPADTPAKTPAKAPVKAPTPPPVAPGSGGYVSTVGTGRSAKAAIAWALSLVGNGRSYHNQCLRFVDDAYAVSHGRTGTAIGQYNRALAAGYAHPGDRKPPIGAQLFWRTSNPARHIALYAGAGMVISSDADSGAIGFVPFSAIDSWGPYLGWASPYYP